MFSPMILVNSLVFALGVVSQIASAAPVLDARDVYVPPITYPHKGTVWHSGQRHNVTWDVSSPPEHITNSIGRVVLRKSGRTTSNILADGFNITAGRIEVTVPSVETGNDYQLVLFGDSGNFSPLFTIRE